MPTRTLVPGQQFVSVVVDKVLGPHALKLLPVSVVHGLLGVCAEEVADASLVVADSFLTVALAPQVTVDVTKPVGPALKLDQVGGLGPHSKVNSRFRVVDHQREP